MDQLDLQSALHILVNADMRLAAAVIERPGTQLIDIAVIMLQNQYVLREHDRITFGHATQELLLIEQNLLRNPAWTERTVSPQKAMKDKQ